MGRNEEGELANNYITEPSCCPAVAPALSPPRVEEAPRVEEDVLRNNNNNKRTTTTTTRGHDHAKSSRRRNNKGSSSSKTKNKNKSPFSFFPILLMLVRTFGTIAVIVLSMRNYQFSLLAGNINDNDDISKNQDIQGLAKMHMFAGWHQQQQQQQQQHPPHPHGTATATGATSTSAAPDTAPVDTSTKKNKNKVQILHASRVRVRPSSTTTTTTDHHHHHHHDLQTTSSASMMISTPNITTVTNNNKTAAAGGGGGGGGRGTVSIHAAHRVVPRSSSSSSTSSPYAYVFMMFRVDPAAGASTTNDTSTTTSKKKKNNNQQRGSYKPYMANILVAAELFRRLGSTSDIVVLISMAGEGGYDHSTIPSEDERLLTELGVKIRYFTPIVPDTQRNFVTVQMNKIELLSLTEYRRVLYLDCDVIPLANLDYLFRFSDADAATATATAAATEDTSTNSIMKPNIILATKKVPLIGGFFMLEPSLEGFEEAKRLVHKKVVLDAGVLFDKQNGWGVPIPKDNPALTNAQPFDHWGFYAARGDQGLFYHYTRFYRRNVSQILSDKILHYGPGPNGTSVLERVDEINNSNSSSNPFDNATVERPFRHLHKPCRVVAVDGGCDTIPGPYMDMAHFIGQGNLGGKPWQTLNPEQYRSSSNNNRTNNTTNNTAMALTSATHLWWKTLYELEDRLNFSYSSEWLQLLHEQDPPKKKHSVVSVVKAERTTNQEEGRRRKNNENKASSPPAAPAVKTTEGTTTGDFLATTTTTTTIGIHASRVSQQQEVMAPPVPQKAIPTVVRTTPGTTSTTTDGTTTLASSTMSSNIQASRVLSSSSP